MRSKNIAFIDARVSGHETLVAKLSADTEWFVLDVNQDGVAQMQAILADYAELDSIQVISHGSAGTLYLGDTVLNADNLAAYKTPLQSIGSRLTETGDILLYGCNVAQGDIGIDFVTSLAKITGADVAASDDPTGGTPTTGNLSLEMSTSQIESEIMVPASYSFLLADTTPPTLMGLSFPTRIDVSGGDTSVTFAAQASDQGSGIKAFHSTQSFALTRTSCEP